MALRIDRSAPGDRAPRRGSARELSDRDTEYRRRHRPRRRRDNLRSGVRSIDFELLDEYGAILDESQRPGPQSCDQRCSKTRTWSFQPQYLFDGTYTLRITATDQLGNAGTDERTIVIARSVRTDPPVTHRRIVQS